MLRRVAWGGPGCLSAGSRVVGRAALALFILRVSGIWTSHATPPHCRLMRGHLWYIPPSPPFSAWREMVLPSPAAVAAALTVSAPDDRALLPGSEGLLVDAETVEGMLGEVRRTLDSACFARVAQVCRGPPGAGGEAEALACGWGVVRRRMCFGELVVMDTRRSWFGGWRPQGGAARDVTPVVTLSGPPTARMRGAGRPGAL